MQLLILDIIIRGWYNKHAKALKTQINMKEKDNMTLKFYSKGDRANEQEAAWAKIFWEDNDWDDEYGDGENKFVRIRPYESVGTVPIFLSQAASECDDTFNWKEEISSLFGKNTPDAVLVCRLDFFKQLVWYSNAAEIEPNIMVAGAERTILYYAFIGKDRCALLIASEPAEN